MPIDPETLLTDPDFLNRVEQAIRFTAGNVAVEPRTVDAWEARQALVGAIADDAAAAEAYGQKFARLLIGDSAIENACASATSQADITRAQIRNSVAPLWTLFATRLARSGR